MINKNPPFEFRLLRMYIVFRLVLIILHLYIKRNILKQFVIKSVTNICIYLSVCSHFRIYTFLKKRKKRGENYVNTDDM